jgi:hypothetical protein
MSLAPLLDAAPAIPLHALEAMTAFVLGVVQLAAPTLVTLPLGVWKAQRHRAADHRRIMISIFLRRACRRRAVYAGARTDHARGGFSGLDGARKCGPERLGFGGRKAGRPGPFRGPISGPRRRVALAS